MKSKKIDNEKIIELYQFTLKDFDYNGLRFLNNKNQKTIFDFMKLIHQNIR